MMAEVLASRLDPEEELLGAFREGMGLMTSTVAIIAARNDAGFRFGMTATAVCSLSLSPPSVVVCVNKTAKTFEALRETNLLSVNLLAEGQELIANAFARHANTQGEADAKFSTGNWTIRDSVPVLDGALSSMTCELSNCFDGGTHWIVVGAVLTVLNQDTNPLLYGRKNYRRIRNDTVCPTY
ncbi:flavin reductase (DIM6/NTAB) family NADH-FMN oxidoreductase RutF [Neorhizobium galegae]|uniref:flavin reductase family protein n=1 Tax=Neorhizobium galegae TaxID=399 RepID=UPI00277F7433|nr:flavin reductase family protein [Neorhizobium galegae]MDQ0137766.1 flavin reductase (DIM6/NTAB) family NADH-FMN oxidoreductase RutF [Neorhizobium galegae]